MCVRAEEAAAQPAAEVYDVNKELEKMKGWKHYLTGEWDKCKAELEKVQTALKAEQQRISELTSTAEQWRQVATAAEAKATAADARATAAEATAAAAEARANAAAASSSETAALTAQLDALKKDAEAAAARAAAAEAKAADAEARVSAQAGSAAALSSQLEAARQAAEAAAARATAAESKATLHAAAADASNGEAAALRARLAEAVAARQALEARVGELGTATAQAGGLRGHALAIYDILLAEAAKHRETALNYANEKLPGLKAKVAEVHATVSAQVPDVPRHVGVFVGRVDGELRPWLRQTLRSVPQLAQYAEDPVVLQGIVWAVLGAPVLLLLLPVLSCMARAFRPRPKPAAGRPGEGKRGGKKKKQG